MWVNVGPRITVSARRHPLRSIDRLGQAVKEGCRFDSSVAILNHLLHGQGDVLVRIAREATLSVDKRPSHRRSDLGKLRRVLVRLRRLLAPEPCGLFRLLRPPPP